ncbi:MAG: T3SS effector HopA1 family protein [Sandaracinaceae bacterium]
MSDVVESLLADRDLAQWSSVPTEELCDVVYSVIYSDPAGDVRKPATVEESRYVSAVTDGYAKTKAFGAWIFRVSEQGSAPEDEPMRRFYLDAKPDTAAVLADALTETLNAGSFQWTLKLPATLGGFARSSAVVIYVRTADYPAAKSAVLEAVDGKSLLGEASTPFAKQLRLGVSAADEPPRDSAHLPPTRDKHSFGTARADAICEVLQGGRFNEPDALVEAARGALERYNVDPTRPWLGDRSYTDDL